ncbi:hypothetical protein D1871_21440 [Nakamurella silvestris]|nr:hypothetical protein D1871_21440 [Nakamurella silvestris]
MSTERRGLSGEFDLRASRVCGAGSRNDNPWKELGIDAGGSNGRRIVVYLFPRSLLFLAHDVSCARNDIVRGKGQV